MMIKEVNKEIIKEVNNIVNCVKNGERKLFAFKINDTEAVRGIISKNDNKIEVSNVEIVTLTH